MTTANLARKLGIQQDILEQVIRKNEIPHKLANDGYYFDDENEEFILELYYEVLEERRERDAETMKQFTENMNVVSDFSNIYTTNEVKGYQIKQYLGPVYGTDIYLVGGLIGGGLASQEKLYGYAFNSANTHLLQHAAEKGANAVIGTTYSITSPGNLNEIIVIANGTAVILEKDET